MDTGKQVLPIAPVYDGHTEDALRNIFIALKILSDEFKITAGTARIETTVTVMPGQAVGILNGKLILADAATSKPAIGIVKRGALTGQKATIVFGMGHIQGLAGLTANSAIYLGNAGALVYSIPGAGMVQGLGWSLSTTDLFVNISQPDGGGGGGGGGSPGGSNKQVQFNDAGAFGGKAGFEFDKATNILTAVGDFIAAGNASAANLSGTNTGDQTLLGLGGITRGDLMAALPTGFPFAL